MGLLDEVTQQEYYEGNGSGYGNYQFTSLEDIINQFIVAYVGEGKIINKIKRTDVAFHAQRAMQELSFDVFKSCKSQEIEIPPSLTMILPQDYVNYVKLTWSDSAGIEHIIYPASKTSNPTAITQDEDGTYQIGNNIGTELINDGDFSLSNPLSNNWNTNVSGASPFGGAVNITANYLYIQQPDGDNGLANYIYNVWQAIDVTGVNSVQLSANRTDVYGTAGTMAFGLNSTEPTVSVPLTSCDIDQITWADGISGINSVVIDVSTHTTVYALIIQDPDGNPANSLEVNTLDDASAITITSSTDLTTTTSDTWEKYSNTTSSGNQNSYDDDYYASIVGERYGLDPQYSQTNGSFFIDCNTGLIHFSSNISGKTVILKYISDGLGTDGEMQVHKFAEEAMYKWILSAIMSTKIGIPEHAIRRYKRDKFTAVRQAKLRLSNIKIEEITQVLRGKSKHIKH